MRKNGFALLLVMVALVIVFAMVITVTLNSKRDADNMRVANQSLNFENINSRVRKIFESVHLCSCNLKGLVTNATIGGSKEIKINPVTGLRDRFGFYQLQADGTCNVGVPGVINANDIVLHVSTTPGPALFPNAAKVREVQIAQLQNLGVSPVNPAWSRFKGVFTFTTFAESELARSNQKSPVEIDLYLDMAAVGPEWMITQCYQPLPVAAPSPAPAPAPAPAPSPVASPAPAPTPAGPCGGAPVACYCRDVGFGSPGFCDTVYTCGATCPGAGPAPCNSLSTPCIPECNPANCL